MEIDYRANNGGIRKGKEQAMAFKYQQVSLNFAINHARHDSDLEEYGSRGANEKWSVSGYYLRGKSK